VAARAGNSVISKLERGIRVPDKSAALYRGRVSVRPWRVGVLVDLDGELADLAEEESVSAG
jgi:hypothetical protein